MSVVLVVSALITGILLGVFGSGGSIITTPALLYLLHIEPKAAIAMSLGVVAITASATALQHWRMGNINGKVAAVFGVFGMAGTYAGARIGVFIPVLLQLVVFAAVMYAAAWHMLKGKASSRLLNEMNVSYPEAISQIQHGKSVYGRIAVHGITIGVLTGVVGVGGGFLIIPALVLLSGLSMKQAVGTSLCIIAIKSFAGFAGYALSIEIDYVMVATFSAVAIIGSFAGSYIGHQMPAEKLQKGFGVFLVLVASYILVNSGLALNQ